MVFPSESGLVYTEPLFLAVRDLIGRFVDNLKLYVYE